MSSVGEQEGVREKMMVRECPACEKTVGEHLPEEVEACGGVLLLISAANDVTASGLHIMVLEEQLKAARLSYDAAAAEEAYWRNRKAAGK